MANKNKFDEAYDLAVALMGKLYEIRYAEKDFSSPVWMHIPTAQTTLQHVIEEINKARGLPASCEKCHGKEQHFDSTLADYCDGQEQKGC